MQLELSNGQEQFWQWDRDQKVKVPDGAGAVHFKVDAQNAVKKAVVDGWEEVPDECFQSGDDLQLWTYDTDHTIDGATVPGTPRQKPTNYTYTPTEIKEWEALDERIKALEQGSTVVGVSSVNGKTGAVTVTADNIGIKASQFDGKFLHIAYSYVDGGGATNSREHYLHCAQNDYDAVKTDLRLTSDNQLVCCHDAGLTFNSDGYIVSYDSTNNTVIHNIAKSQFLGYTFNTQYNGEHCHPCDLETYLNICKTYGKIAYINIRGEYIAETVTALIAALKQASFGMENVIINSFTKDALTAVRAAEPKLYLSLVIDPFTASERTTALNFAQTTGACQICLYYSNGSHTLAEMTADSAISGWISDCIAAGIRLVGAQVNDSDEISTLLNQGMIGAQTRLSRLNDALALNIADLEVTATSGDSSTTLTLRDGKGNQKSAEIPKLTLSDSQVQAGVESWMDENAKPTTVWSKNVYNPDDAVTGYIASGGQVNGSADYWSTGFIPVSPGDVLTISKSGALLNAYYQAAYDSSKALVSRLTNSASSYTVPDGAAYVRFSIKNTQAAITDPVMICINNTDLSYVAYGSHTEGGLGAYLVLQSPSGKNFTLSVADDGTITATEIN